MEKAAAPDRPTVTAGEHLIGRFIGAANGPTLIVFGSLHGNEAAGVRALQKVAEDLRALELRLKGRVFFVAGNTRAILQGVRFIDSDLNRHWTRQNIDTNTERANSPNALSEDLEQFELLELIEEILRTAKTEVYALDLHSTSAEGAPFATVGDTLRNRTFAQKFPITILLGIEEQLEGTLLEYMNNRGAVTLGYEAGQHYAESTVATHAALVWAALANTGVLDPVFAPNQPDPVEVLRRATGGAKIYEVRYRHAITPADDFVMDAGFENFDKVTKGQKLAEDSRGAVQAGENGVILMPLYQKLGEDGFFLGRQVAPFWLWLSGVLRRLRVGDLMAVLPGVRRSAEGPDVLEIDTRIARFFPLQIFHLLGFRKLRKVGDQLVVSRRKFDRQSPFVKGH